MLAVHTCVLIRANEPPFLPTPQNQSSDTSHKVAESFVRSFGKE